MDPVLSISRRILNLSGWTFSNCTRSSTPPASAEVGLRIGCTVRDPVVIRALTSMLTAYGKRSAAFLYLSAEILEQHTEVERAGGIAASIRAPIGSLGLGHRALPFEQNAEVGGARGRRERRTPMAHLALRRCPRFLTSCAAHPALDYTHAPAPSRLVAPPQYVALWPAATSLRPK
jgi:hypothetical protein